MSPTAAEYFDDMSATAAEYFDQITYLMGGMFQRIEDVAQTDVAISIYLMGSALLIGIGVCLVLAFYVGLDEYNWWGTGWSTDYSNQSDSQNNPGFHLRLGAVVFKTTIFVILVIIVVVIILLSWVGVGICLYWLVKAFIDTGDSMKWKNASLHKETNERLDKLIDIMIDIKLRDSNARLHNETNERLDKLIDIMIDIKLRDSDNY